MTSSLVRWMHPDHAGLAAVDWNRYAYVRSNPNALVDPLGLSDCPDLKAVFGDIGGDLNGAPGVDLFGSVSFGPGNPANGCVINTCEKTGGGDTDRGNSTHRCEMT